MKHRKDQRHARKKSHPAADFAADAATDAAAEFALWGLFRVLGFPFRVLFRALDGI